MASKNRYLSHQVEGGVARGSHTCKKFSGREQKSSNCSKVPVGLKKISQFDVRMCLAFGNCALLAGPIDVVQVGVCVRPLSA